MTPWARSTATRWPPSSNVICAGAARASGARWLVSNGQFRVPRRNRSKPAPPERTLSDFRGPADQITLSKIAIFGGGRLFAIQNTSHLERLDTGAGEREQIMFPATLHNERVAISCAGRGDHGDGVADGDVPRQTGSLRRGRGRNRVGAGHDLMRGSVPQPVQHTAHRVLGHR